VSAASDRSTLPPVTVIELFADVCCPFTHVGLRRLVAEREARGRDDVVLRIRAWPLELVNGVPLDPALIAEEVDELRAQVAPDLFAGFDPGRFPASSMPALVVAAAAYEHGPEVGERVSLHLRAALFEEAKDIADPAVLLDVVTAAGIELPTDGCRRQVEADWAEGRARGVTGSPHFFVGGDGWFCPALDIARVDGHLRIQPDAAAFDAFAAACFD
jgi:predicted DsbA family dithiol-disulfide isomerase